MSDNLPIEIQAEIMKKLPVKSVLQCRSVSKEWKSLIDSSDFINRYTGLQQHLLASYHDPNREYVSIVDDDAFPQHKVSLTVPSLVNTLESCRTIGCSRGLLCLYSCDDVDIEFPTFKAVIWNLSIRKAVSVTIPNSSFGRYSTVLGFGVCGKTSDPKIFKIAYAENWKGVDNISCIPWHVKVFTLSTGVWRPPYGTNLPRKSLKFECYLFGVEVGGAFYWLATDRISMDGELKSVRMIVSFDITSEEFREISLPDTLASRHYNHDLSISKVRESLLVIEGYLCNDQFFHVWMMGDGVPELFTKMFTICTPGAVILSILEFRKSGEPIIEIMDDSSDPYKDDSSLVVYEPYSKHITNLGISGTCSFYLSSAIERRLWIWGICSFSLYSYEETLLLLDQPDVTNL